MPEVDAEQCTGCGKCVSLCPVGAMSLVSAHDPRHRSQKKAQIDERYCLGCGVCVRPCPRAAIKLKPRRQRVITPVSSVHRAVLMATERGKLQNLLFDNQVYASHRAMAAVLGAVLKLTPVKQTMAQKQLHSRYVDALLARQR
jgi:Fe-S-cluster-containing hydrogenase component 2